MKALDAEVRAPVRAGVDAGWREAAHRAIDLVGAAVALVLAAPVMAVIAVAVRATSAGPALFRQQRVGRHGRPITVHKFRTMLADADDAPHRRLVEQQMAGEATPAGDGVHKLADDDRVTPLGRVLRRWSFDELPQLVDVLRGDMALVGPRPALPYEVARYGELESRRLLVKPGLTGLWQVSGRNLVSMRRMFELDAAYVERRSPALDLRILARTPGELLRPSGAR